MIIFIEKCIKFGGLGNTERSSSRGAFLYFSPQIENPTKPHICPESNESNDLKENLSKPYILRKTERIRRPKKNLIKSHVFKGFELFKKLTFANLFFTMRRI